MRVIIHADLNNFYASVECLLNPTLKGKYVGVCGNIESRHGIILAKSENAKKLGVKTGMTIREAQKLCPELILVEAHHSHYDAYSKLVKNIYLQYTDYIESFGIDECWLDVTGSVKLFGSGEEIAYKIKEQVKRELGLTISCGVSFNKVFAKLGSDMKKPDAVTVISQENFKEKIWSLPASDLLYIGRSTTQKLTKINIKTIGDLANTDRDFLENKFGKWGGILHDYALGLDLSPVLKYNEDDEVKSVGNSLTSYRDLQNYEDVKIVFSILCESVAERVSLAHLNKASVLSIYVRDNTLKSITRQCKLSSPSKLPEDYSKTAIELFKKEFKEPFSIRTLGVSVSGFVINQEQITFDDENSLKRDKLNDTILNIKQKYGKKMVCKGIVLKDKKIMREDPAETHNSPV